MLHVTDFLFNDHCMESPEEYDNWEPENPADVDEWIKILVGQREGEGHWFQVHVCTYHAMSSVIDKRYMFPIEYWVSVDDLIDKLDKFISDTLKADLDLENDLDYGIAMENLSKYWLWEYAKYA